MGILLSTSVTFVCFVYSLVFLLASGTYASDDVESDIQELISRKDMAHPSVSESVSTWAAKHPEDALAMLLARAKAPGVTDDALGTYIWAMGFTRKPQAIDEIILLTKEKESPFVKRNAVIALSTIGGERIPTLLMERLDKEQDKNLRYIILNVLSQMHYEPVIPLAAELLLSDPRVSHWYPVFVFGKLGDMAVPFLLGKVQDKDHDIRANALLILGHYLVAPEAARVMQNLYWSEDDADIRRLILSSLERITPDLKEQERFFREVSERFQRGRKK